MEHQYDYEPEPDYGRDYGEPEHGTGFYIFWGLFILVFLINFMQCITEGIG